MKKTFLIALMAFFATLTVMAQDLNPSGERQGPDPEKRIERQIKHLDKKLNLTEDQQKLLKEYYGEFNKAQMARMQQMRQMEMRDRKALDGKIIEILTEEQKAKFDEMKEQEKEMWKEGMGRPEFGPGHGPGRGMHPMGPGGMRQHGENTNFND